MPFDFTEEQMERYSRQIIMPEVGGKGQEKLGRARVLMVGAGGLGSPAAYYLAAAGVGTIGIIDSDAVEMSNLQRQILHSTHRIGRPKAESAGETLRMLNPDVEIVPYSERLTPENTRNILEGYDVVVDGSDNFPTRYLVNDACVMLKKPLVYGAVLRLEGQAMTIVPGEGPCYRCLFQEPPPPDMAPSCQQAGVLGVVPGIIGIVQATEALKLMLGIGDLLVGRLLIYDALRVDFRTLEVRRNQGCPICGDNPTITELADHKPSCMAD